MTLAPEHPLVQEITTPEYQDKINEYILASSKRSKENVWLMSKPFQEYTEHMLSILLPKSRFRFGLGIMFCRLWNRCCYGSSGDERDYTLLISLKLKAECRK
jgi:hypothetical protein